MKKLLLIFLFVFPSSFAMSAECYRQRNSIGFTDYDVCEVAGTGYICVSLEDSTSGISCFPAPKYYEAPARREIIRKVIKKEDVEDSNY